jgi:LmbE family N-acetylglucosaminyl deacetylase
MIRRIAAIFAHPDDEILACGGTMAAHARAGHEVRSLILATGLASRGAVSDDEISRLRAQGEAAARKIGAAGIEFADFPDNAMDSVPLIAVVQRIEAFLKRFAADVIYTHHSGDLNVDHRIVAQAVVTARRPLPGAGAVEILACEIPSATEWSAPGQYPFVPTDFVEIADHLAAKQQALACYEGELRAWPHPRSLEGVAALARWRGSQSGYEAAEAFYQIRRVRGAV